MSTLRLVTMRAAIFSFLTLFFFAIVLVATISNAAHASVARSGMRMSGGGGGGGSSQEMLVDFTFQRVRDIKADGKTDNAGRISIGGMFSSWLGLDLQAMMEVQSKSYLVGGDFRITPTDWFFLKAGMGGYASPDSKALKATPLGGAGIMARLTHEVYLVTETSYFQVEQRHNVGFGAGLGLSF